MAFPEAPPPLAAPDDDAAGHLHRRIAELAEAVAVRDSFIAIAAHELRNSMTPVMGQVDLMLSAVRAGKWSMEQVEQRLGRLEYTVRRYLKRAVVLLDVSKLTGGKFQFELEAFDLAALLREVADEFAAARHAGASLQVVAPATLPVTLDPLATEQIIDNLISNALKYGARTPVEVAATMLGTQIRIQVRDHGGGVPARDRARIFERFERAVGKGGRHSSFGVGLWVVAQFVAAMQGAITIGDAPGGGALFTVTLPMHLKGARH